MRLKESSNGQTSLLHERWRDNLDADRQPFVIGRRWHAEPRPSREVEGLGVEVVVGVFLFIVKRRGSTVDRAKDDID